MAWRLLWWVAMKCRIACIALALAGACTSMYSSSDEPVISGDPCAVYTTKDACALHAQQCDWSGPLPCGCEDGSGSSTCTCPPPDPDSGECIQRCDTPCTVELQPGCACPEDKVCFEQNGGPVGCVLPEPGDGDPCARITGHGTCTQSDNVAGLCLCQ